MNNNIALLFGGNSCERDISIITAVQLYESIDKSKYTLYPIYIHEDGMYLIRDMRIDTFISNRYSGGASVKLINGGIDIRENILKHNKIKIDCALLATHGGIGENGALQGHLEMYDIPYTSSDVMASSILMDKVTTKVILEGLDIPHVEYICIYSNKIDYVNIVNTLGMPVIVKPASQGSSIGIKVANNESELKDAIELAFCYDTKIIIERALTAFKEYNIAIYKRGGKLIVSDIESPHIMHDMLDFDDKYMSSGKMNGGYREFPAKMDDIIRKRMEEYSIKVYTALDMKGVARFDYMVENDNLYLNEVNTIPGSLAYYLFENKGISYDMLVSDMIDEAVCEHANKGNLIRYYKSSVLKTAKYAVNKLRK